MLAAPPLSRQAPAALTPCPLWRRLAALGYDALILLALLATVGLFAQAASHGQLIDSHGHLHACWYRPLQGAMIAGYFLLSWRRGGQTLGLRAWRVRLLRHDGSACRDGQLLLRLGAGAAPLAALWLAPYWGLRPALTTLALLTTLSLSVALFDRQQRSLPDLCAGTLLCGGLPRQPRHSHASR